MPELLLELGTEELPATFVRKAYTDLLHLVVLGLSEAGLLVAEGTSLGTPRRLIVSFPDVKERQEDQEKEMRGPALRAAYDNDGNPTPALLGFCRGQGVDVANVRKDEQYVWVTKRIPGRPASEILRELLPEAIRKLTFDKSMRWGSSRMRFARPIRWILASLGGEIVPFDIEGVVSGLQSRGHRFYAPAPFEARTLDQLLGELRARFVEPEFSVRKARILDGARAVAAGTPDLPEALVDENAFLTEWPTPIQGEFRADFQELPEAVLVTAMAKHEKMFPVRDAEGRLTNRFVFVRNSGEDDSVRAGAEWVLNARFNDAKFFYDEDRKLDLDGFLAKTETILFQEKLGTMRARADRLARLAEAIANATGGDPHEANLAHQAGLYAKADLATGLVGELTSLQGVIGGEYARRHGLPEPVCRAISLQYDHGRAIGDRTAARLIMADQLDKLAGYLGLGLEPSGSSDPYALRRAATILIELAWAWPGALPPYEELFAVALDLYREAGVPLDEAAATAALRNVFAGRYSALMPEVRHDILDAAIVEPQSPGATQPRAVRFRANALAILAADVPFVQTATRPLNIVMAARRKGIEYGVDGPLTRLEHSALSSTEGLELFQALAEGNDALLADARAENLDAVVAYLRGLALPINRFFETTMVMADEAEVRYARLTLMHATSLQLLVAGDFSKLVIEG